MWSVNCWAVLLLTLVMRWWCILLITRARGWLTLRWRFQNMKYCSISIAAHFWSYDGSVFNVCPCLTVRPAILSSDLRFTPQRVIFHLIQPKLCSVHPVSACRKNCHLLPLVIHTLTCAQEIVKNVMPDWWQKRSPYGQYLASTVFDTGLLKLSGKKKNIYNEDYSTVPCIFFSLQVLKL